VNRFAEQPLHPKHQRAAGAAVSDNARTAQQAIEI